jgi:hypothetical protein
MFYRARLGTSVIFKFSLAFLAENAAEWAFPPVFPMSLSGYRLNFEVDNDYGYPPASNVLFTGPSMTNSPSDVALRIKERA